MNCEINVYDREDYSFNTFFAKTVQLQVLVCLFSSTLSFHKGCNGCELNCKSTKGSFGHLQRNLERCQPQSKSLSQLQNLNTKLKDGCQMQKCMGIIRVITVPKVGINPCSRSQMIGVNRQCHKHVHPRICKCKEIPFATRTKCKTSPKGSL